MKDTEKKPTLPIQADGKLAGEKTQEATSEPKTQQDLRNIADQRLFSALELEMKKLN